MAESIIDEILKKRGVKYDDLSLGERENLFRMVEVLNKSALTMDRWREFIKHMKEEVEKELVNEPEFNRIFIFKVDNRRQIYLKARLKNYLLLEAFLDTPQKAKEAVLQNIGGGVTKI